MAGILDEFLILFKPTVQGSGFKVLNGQIKHTYENLFSVKNLFFNGGWFTCIMLLIFSNIVVFKETLYSSPKCFSIAFLTFIEKFSKSVSIQLFIYFPL